MKKRIRISDYTYPDKLEKSLKTIEDILKIGREKYLSKVGRIDSAKDFAGLIYSAIQERIDSGTSPEAVIDLILSESDRLFEEFYLPIIKQKNKETIERVRDIRKYSEEIDFVGNKAIKVRPYEEMAMRKSKMKQPFLCVNINDISKMYNLELRKLLYILKKTKFPLSRTRSGRTYYLVWLPLFQAVLPILERYWRYEKNYKDWAEYFKNTRKLSNSGVSHYIRRQKIVTPYFFEIQPCNRTGKINLLLISKNHLEGEYEQPRLGEFPLRDKIIKELSAIDWNDSFIAIKEELLKLAREKEIKFTGLELKSHPKMLRSALREMANSLDRFIDNRSKASRKPHYL